MNKKREKRSLFRCFSKIGFKSLVCLMIEFRCSLRSFLTPCHKIVGFKFNFQIYFLIFYQRIEKYTFWVRKSITINYYILSIEKSRNTEGYKKASRSNKNGTLENYRIRLENYFNTVMLPFLKKTSPC